MDLETRIFNGIMTSYCISIYDGENLESFKLFHIFRLGYIDFYFFFLFKLNI